MRILVTGAGGMIGRAVVRELLAGGEHEVNACYHSLPVPHNYLERLQITTCDLLDKAASEELLHGWRPDCLIHLAWCPVGSCCHSTSLHLEWTEASAFLIRRFVELGGRRFIGCGSFHEYGLAKELPLSEENTVPNPVSLYGHCKLVLGAYAGAVAEDKGLSFLWPRIGYVIGRGCSATLLFGEAMQAALLKRDFTCRIAPETAFDILDVRDLARLYTLAVSDDSFTGTVNFATGKSVNVRALLEHIFELGNCSDKLHYAMPLNPPQQVILDNSRLVEHLHVDSFREPLTLKASDLWDA